MARKYYEPAYRGFAITAESPYGTAEAAATRTIPYIGNATLPSKLAIDTDAGEKTGNKYRTTHNVLRWALDLVHEQRLIAADAGLFLALVGGSVTSAAQGGTAAYLHAIEIDDAVTDLVSTTMWEDTPSYGQKEFTGICCTQVEIEWERGEFIIMRATLIGDGAEASGDDLSGIGVIDTAEVYLKYNDVDVLMGGTYTEPDNGSIAAGTSIKDQVRSGKITIKNAGDRVWHLGEGDIYSSAVVKGDLKAEDQVMVELDIEPASAAPSLELDLLLAQTLQVMEIKIVGASMGGAEAAYDYTVDFMFPNMLSEEATLDHDNNVQTTPQKFMALKETANGWPLYQAQVMNKDVAYLG